MNIFPWLVFSERFNPIDRVKKLTFIVFKSELLYCILCLEGGDDLPHFFFHYSFSRSLCDALFQDFRCFWVFDEKAKKELFSFLGPPKEETWIHNMVKSVLHGICTERNKLWKTRYFGMKISAYLMKKGISDGK